MRASKLIERNVIDIRETKACSRQAVANGFARKAGPVFDPTKTLFFGCSNELAVNDKRSRRIPVEGIKTKNNQEENLMLGGRPRLFDFV